jgi:F-type H+-transporting ATPase subunit a
MESPIAQFNLVDLIPIKMGAYNLSFTNSGLFMTAAVVLISLFFIRALKGATIAPGRLQSAAEIIYGFVLQTTNSSTLGKGERYFPFVLSLFCFILTLNVIGVIPTTLTVTSHLSVTFALAMIVFIAITVIAFALHGMHFFSFFLPPGTPLFLAPLMVLIELFTYLSRPLSLSIRLAANMTVGHILLFVIASFITMMGVWGFIPIPLIFALNIFELFVAVLQAYIFSLLTCIYINDAINLH